MYVHNGEWARGGRTTSSAYFIGTVAAAVGERLTLKKVKSTAKLRINHARIDARALSSDMIYLCALPKEEPERGKGAYTYTREQ